MLNSQPSLNDVTLIIATFNEEESIDYVLDELTRFNIGEIIIVDGNSTDRTEEIALNYNIRFIKQEKEGWGNAVREAINLSTKQFITYMDGDGSYNPSAIPEMRSLMQTNDVIFCSRYKGGEKSPDDTFIRAIGNKFFTQIVRLRYGCKITDSLFFYPMLNREILDLISLKSQDFTLCVELPVLVHQKELRYTEILSKERERYAGKSKVNALIDGWKILKGILLISK
tara:strand:- start:25 stop:705 length:681 start_codon:yes stop_codon:yes gene_type:complete